MKEELYISKYAIIESGVVTVNNQEVFKAETQDFQLFSKAVYQQLSLAYPKFFKMDPLSKLAILGAEYVLEATDEGQDIALVFANKSSSLDTDIKHQNSITDPEAYYPSPAIFVYTLANICLGEVSIKHRLQSENVFFVAPTFPIEQMYNYSAYLLESKKAKKVLCGWVEYYQEEYKLAFYLVETQGSVKHNTEEIQNIIK